MTTDIKQKFYLIVFAVVFGSGFLIYLWGRMHGVDLTQAPSVKTMQIDLPSNAITKKNPTEEIQIIDLSSVSGSVVTTPSASVSANVCPAFGDCPTN